MSDTVLKGSVWKTHGKAVADAAPYFPRSFDRTPRNPAKKISSGYKAWELLLYFYGLGPGLFHGVLPQKYYLHYCKLVVGVHVIYQRRITRLQLQLAHRLLLEWVLEFELLYYQRKVDRLHFVRQCVHSLTHLGPETARLGPPSLSAQWTMERVIGIFGSLLKQPSNPFANLTEQAKKIAEINSLIAIWPELEPQTKDPHGSIDIGHGYLLLGPKDEKPYNTTHLSLQDQFIDGEDSKFQENKLHGLTGKKKFALPEKRAPIGILRSTHTTVMENIIDNVVDISKRISARIQTSQTSPDSITPTDADTPMAIDTPSGPPTTSRSVLKYTRQPLPQLDRANYTGVNHWENDGYNGSRKGGKRGGEDALEEKPKISVLSSFMEDESGREIPEKVRKAVRKTAKQFFQEILDNNRAPANWGEAARDIESKLIHILESEFFWLRLCEGHWKANKVATNSYSQWYGKAIRRKAAAEARKIAAMKQAAADVIDVDADDTDNNRPSKRPRDEEDETTGRPKHPRIEERRPSPRPHPTPTGKDIPPKKDMFANLPLKLAVEMIPLTQAVPEASKEKTPPPAPGLSPVSNNSPASVDSAPIVLETSIALAAAIVASTSTAPVPGPAPSPALDSVSPPGPVLATVTAIAPAAPVPTTLVDSSSPSTARDDPGKASKSAKKPLTLLVAPTQASAGPSASGSGLADNSDVQQDTQVTQKALKKKTTTKKAKAAPKKAPVKKKFKKLTGKELFYGDWKAANPQKEQVDFENAWKAGRPVDRKNDDREKYEKEEAEKEQAEKEQAEKET
ncbi:hypothetical protein BJ322DRAFT_1108591 [Thelephora terrestris]|uniref:Uncharacterized protein n=1 Tax=Thelephora terrestris TaxID=56493 RepID=A0A9P6HEG5_9AGAM|nr:hypothetical protein BJ322DRAFT_1108591 [Thelephora terrestris]